MTIIEALNSRLQSNHGVLFTKMILDGFTSIGLTMTLGIGAIIFVSPLYLYQGMITLFASIIEKMITDEILQVIINEMTGVGGVLIIAIGLNMLNLTKIRIINLLPALFIIVILLYIRNYFGNTI